MLGGAYSYNDKSTRVHGQNGAIIRMERPDIENLLCGSSLKVPGIRFSLRILWDVPVVLLYSPPIRIYRSLLARG